MIADNFDSRTRANMDVALERACALLPAGAEQHENRRYIARGILKCAEGGDVSLSGLTEASGRAAQARKRQSTPAKYRMMEKVETATSAVTAQENPTRTAT